MSKPTANPALRLLLAIEAGGLALILSTMIGLAAYQVFARNVLDSGLLWGDAMVRVLVLWVAMLGAMVASHNDDHIRMDLLHKLIKPSWQPGLRRVTSLFTSVVLGVFAWYSFEFVRYEYEDGLIAFAGVPAWLCESIMPFGSLVMCVRYLMHTFNPP